MSTIDVLVYLSSDNVFSYSGSGVSADGSIKVTKAQTTINYILQNPEPIFFLSPVLKVTEPASAPLDISSIAFSTDKKTMILTDSDAHTETICLQLQVQLTDGSTILSPDPKIRDNKPQ